MPKICEMTGVREYAEKYPVELRSDNEIGRLTIAAYNEAKCGAVDIDLLDLVGWMVGPGRERLLENGFDPSILALASQRDERSD